MSIFIRIKRNKIVKNKAKFHDTHAHENNEKNKLVHCLYDRQRDQLNASFNASSLADFDKAKEETLLPCVTDLD